MTKQRQRKFSEDPLRKKLSDFIARCRAEAETLPPGAKRDELLDRADFAELNSSIEAWLDSAELKPAD